MLLRDVRVYKNRSLTSLLNSLLVLNSCRFQGLVKSAPRILRLSHKLGLSGVSNSFIKHTFFKYFCGGENLSEVAPVMEDLQAAGIGCILDLAIEETGVAAKELVVMFCKSIDIACQGSDNFISLKLSAFDYSTTGIDALNTICSYAKKNNVKVMIDAEGSAIQPKIDEITSRLADLHNTESAVVWQTYQMYLKDSFPRLVKDLQRKHRHIGIKLVRGAYMASEPRGLVHDSIQDTHDNYDTSVQYCINELSKGQVIELMLATHNLDSIQKAIIAGSACTVGSSKNIKFGQLYGMKDDLTYGLASAGFSVYKYIPYGPVGTALPYLLRRAHENACVLETLAIDNKLYMTEIKKRFFFSNV